MGIVYLEVPAELYNFSNSQGTFISSEWEEKPQLQVRALPVVHCCNEWPHESIRLARSPEQMMAWPGEGHTCHILLREAKPAVADFTLSTTWPSSNSDKFIWDWRNGGLLLGLVLAVTTGLLLAMAYRKCHPSASQLWLTMLGWRQNQWEHYSLHYHLVLRAQLQASTQTASPGNGNSSCILWIWMVYGHRAGAKIHFSSKCASCPAKGPTKCTVQQRHSANICTEITVIVNYGSCHGLFVSLKFIGQGIL